MSNPVEIPFHPRHRTAIEAGDKRFSIRVDPGYDPLPGELLTLVDEDRELIREARCTLNAITAARWIPYWHFGESHTDYPDVNAVIDELEEYYPDHDIEADTPVKVIGWAYR